MDLLSEIVAEIAAEIIADYDNDDDVFYDAEEPAPETSNSFSLWDEDINSRFEALKTKKDDVLDRVVDLIADVPQLRREVVRLQNEVRLLKAVLTQPPVPASDPSPSPSNPSPPTLNPELPPPLKKKRKRKRKRKHPASFIAPPSAPIFHSTPAPPRHPPILQSHPPAPPPPPDESSQELPYTPVTRSSQRSTRPNITQNVHFYHDSNNKYTTQQNIQTTINNIHEMTSKPQQKYNITFHKTFTLQRTLRDIKMRDLSNSIIIIDTTTNNAKYDHEDQTSPHHTHNTLRNIILTLQHKNINNKNIIILETIPSLKFDIHPYNLAAAATCKQLGVRFCPNLVGESHLWEDGIHVAHPHRPLHISSVAAAIVGIDPHQIFRIQRPPLGRYGPWRFPWGS